MHSEVESTVSNTEVSEETFMWYVFYVHVCSAHLSCEILAVRANMGGVVLSVEHNNVFNHRAFDSVAGQTVNLSMAKQSGQTGRQEKRTVFIIMLICGRHSEFQGLSLTFCMAITYSI